MIKSEFGKIAINVWEKSGECQLRFLSDFSDHDAYLCTLNEKGIDNLICLLEYAKRKNKEWKETVERIVKTTNFSKLYNEFEERYNKYPVQMSYAEAFGHAYQDGLIDELTYTVAQNYYGKLWNYVGD